MSADYRRALCIHVTITLGAPITCQFFKEPMKDWTHTNLVNNIHFSSHVTIILAARYNRIRAWTNTNLGKTHSPVHLYKIFALIDTLTNRTTVDDWPTRIFQTGISGWFHWMKKSRTFVWNRSAARWTAVCRFSSRRGTNAPRSTRHLTVASAPELAASNSGVDFSLRRRWAQMVMGQDGKGPRVMGRDGKCGLGGNRVEMVKGRDGCGPYR